MRIFFDTNVLIAAYLWKGVARHVFEVAITDHTPVVSEDVIEEAKRVLSRKFDYLAVTVPRIARPEDFRDVLPDAP